MGSSESPDRDVEYTTFEEFWRPLPEHRVTAFGSTRKAIGRARTCADNTPGGIAVIDRHTEIRGYLFATGFSGHEILHRRGVGRAVTELIIFGRNQPTDPFRSGYEGVGRHAPLPEPNAVRAE